MQNGFGIPLPHIFRMKTYQAVLEGIPILVLHIDNRIRLSDLIRRYYQNIIYKLPFTELLILIAKLFLWGCARNQTRLVITAFSSKVKIKYETDKYICANTNKMDKFNRKWALPLDSVHQCRVQLERIFLFLYSYLTVKVHSVM